MSTNTAVNIRRTNLVSRAKKDIEKNKVLYIMLIPFTVWYLLFIYKPIGGLIAAFKDFNKSVAGKTGSAQAESKEKGKYANGWFVGFTPYKDPEVAVVVFLEDGSTNLHAAKAARKILDAYYNTNIEESENLKEDMSAEIYAEQ